MKPSLKRLHAVCLQLRDRAPYFFLITTGKKQVLKGQFEKGKSGTHGRRQILIAARQPIVRSEM